MKESFCQSTFMLALSKHVDKKIKNKTTEIINTCAVDLPLSGQNSHPLAQRTDRYLAWYGETPAIFQTDGRDHRLSASTRAIRKLMNGHGGLMPVWSSIGLGWNCGNRREAHRLMRRWHLRFFSRHGGKNCNATSGSGRYMTERRSDGQLSLPPVWRWSSNGESTPK